jgi:LuxR family maltose regulon positive regulatory protein
MISSQPRLATVALVTTPLLTTKLYLPPLRQEMVSRPRLIERLNAGLVCKLTLISAPAGFGKTTLLSEWISTLEPLDEERGWTGESTRDRVSQTETHNRVAWLSLDERDNDPDHFWIYIVAALQTIAPGLGATTLALLEPQPVAPSLSMAPIQHRAEKETSHEPRPGKAIESDRTEVALTALINEIAATQPDGDHHPLILVLDDYHVIETEAIHAGLTFLLDHLPPARGLHLVIASRSDPPLPLSRLRGRGQLNELDETDLRFTPDEASTFLNKVMGLELSAQDVADLEARTEGWIVGLQMAAQSIIGRSSGILDSVRSPTTDRQPSTATEFIRSFTGSHRDVVDYLTDEVLLQQPAEVQTFLLQTSILDRLCGPLCDAVCTQRIADSPPLEAMGQSAQDTLEYLDTANLFIVPLDSERIWFRYHHLFAELLRQRVNRRHPDLPPALHLRASEWYAKEGLIDQAVYHALMAGDYEHVADLIQQHVGDAFGRGQFKLILGWMEALPDELVRSRPLLCVVYAFSAMGDNLELADHWIEEAQTSLTTWSQDEELSSADPDLYDMVNRHVATFRAITARGRGVSSEEVVELIQTALEVVPESDLLNRSLLATQLAIEKLNAGYEETAERNFAEAIRLGESGGFHYIHMVATYALAIIARRRGCLRDVAAMCRRSIASIVEPIERSGRRIPVGGFTYITLGRVLVEWNDLTGAELALTKGLASTKLLPMDDAQLAGYMAMARLRIAQGDVERLPHLDGLILQNEGWFKEWADMIRARVWLMRSHREPYCLEPALRWAEKRKLKPEDWDGGIWEQLTRARVFIMRSRVTPSAQDLSGLQPVLDFLDAQLQIVEMHGWVEWMINTLIVQALAFQAQGREDQALKALERALTLAEPEGYTRIFLDEGLPMARLLYRVAQRSVIPDYAGKLLAAFDTPPTERVDMTVGFPTTKVRDTLSIVEPLTPREIEVLQLIAEGLSNREIAQRLSISLSTVKRHNANIYGKLATHNRTQAVARARDLGLL